MKTLDEVIKAFEICTSNDSCVDGCPYYKNDCPTYVMEKDALHYLKEYQETVTNCHELKGEKDGNLERH